MRRRVNAVEILRLVEELELLHVPGDVAGLVLDFEVLHLCDETLLLLVEIPGVTEWEGGLGLAEDLLGELRGRLALGVEVTVRRGDLRPGRRHVESLIFRLQYRPLNGPTPIRMRASGRIASSQRRLLRPQIDRSDWPRARDLDQHMGPQAQVQRPHVRPQPTQLHLADLLVVMVLLDRPAIRRRLDDRLDSGIGAGAEERPPCAILLPEDHDPHHAAGRSPSRQEALEVLGDAFACVCPVLDGLPTPLLPGPLGQAQAVLAVDRWTTPPPLPARCQHWRQVVQGGILAEPGDHDEVGPLRGRGALTWVGNSSPAIQGGSPDLGSWELGQVTDSAAIMILVRKGCLTEDGSSGKDFSRTKSRPSRGSPMAPKRPWLTTRLMLHGLASEKTRQGIRPSSRGNV